jgi:histidinol-phosphatase (PHP family)
LILSLGGRFALSDDSHGPPFVALNYSRLRTYAKDVLKLEEIWHLEKIDGEERNAGGRKTRAVKWSDQSGNGRGWWEDEFWDRCITRL